MSDSITSNFSIIIPIHNVGLKTEENIISEIAEISSIQSVLPLLSDIVLDRMEINLIKWDKSNSDNIRDLNNYCLTDQLPKGFDRIAHLSQKPAFALLIITLCESYPNLASQNLLKQVDNSIYGSFIISALYKAFKFYHDKNMPYFHTGYYFKNKLKTGFELFWPLKDINGPALEINQDVWKGILELFRLFLYMEKDIEHSVGNRIIGLASNYYIHTTTQSESNIIFLLLIIAFEALFKKRDEKTINKAINRFSKLISKRKADRSGLVSFMSENPRIRGCYYMRNSIVHGENIWANYETFYKLRSHMRNAIIDLSNAIFENEINPLSYYDSLDNYVNLKYGNLL